ARPGRTASTLAIAAAAASDGGSYDVVVTNACGSATSAAAGLVVDALPQIGTPPANATACEGAGSSFSVVATGSGQPSYQWRKDGADLPGATGPSFSIAAVAASDAGSYDVVVTNGCGSVTSAAATLTLDT